MGPRSTLLLLESLQHPEQGTRCTFSLRNCRNRTRLNTENSLDSRTAALTGVRSCNTMAQPVGVTDPIEMSVGGLSLGAVTMHVMDTVRPGAGQAPMLAGGLTEEKPSFVLASLHVLLAQQQQQYGNGEQPPGQVQHQPYSGPPMRYLISGRPVRYLASFGGCGGGGGGGSHVNLHHRPNHANTQGRRCVKATSVSV
jgi:hypothetical protein